MPAGSALVGSVAAHLAAHAAVAAVAAVAELMLLEAERNCVKKIRASGFSPAGEEFAAGDAVGAVMWRPTADNN